MLGASGKSMDPPLWAVGQLVAGKYRIEAVLGEGAWGTVLAARHELLDDYVAVKLLAPELAREESLVERFLREAKAAARLRSEHVARVRDVDTLESGQPYIVMELLEGEDLDQRLRREARLAIPAAVDFILQALEAMAHAHAAGIVHRDLKPANLFVVTTPDRGEILKVLDFGIAKLAERPSPAIGARPGEITGEHPLGSPSYMAPEQIRHSKEVDGRADIWALGAILYELLTGRIAFVGDSVGEIFATVLHESPRPLEELRPDAPAQVVSFVNRCLERDADRRFEDVAAAARAIGEFGSGSFASYIERIEHTLRQAGRPSDPRAWRRGSVLNDSIITAGPPSSKRVPALASTLHPPMRARARFPVLALAAAVVMGIIAAAAFPRVRAPAASSSSSAPPANTPLAAPVPTPAPSARSTIAPPGSATASVPAAPSASVVPHTSRKPLPKPAPPPSASPPPAPLPSPAGLPSALMSPE